MKRLMLIALVLFLIPTLFQTHSAEAAATDTNQLPPPIVTENSVEICLNSRYSQHSLSGTASIQQISNIVWAAGKAPFTGTHRDIYLLTPEATYLYDPNSHSLRWYSSQPRDDGAFAIRYESERDFDTGVSFMPALLASVSLCRSTESPVASCPKGIGYPNARLIFGVQSSRELTTELAVHCSIPEGEAGWLPDPSTTGDNSLEEILSNLRYINSFTEMSLSLQQISQILWAGYGCTYHNPSGRAGLTVPSAWANYYLTGTIYLANENGVFRYHNRNPTTNLTTRDHRLEQIDSGSTGRSGTREVDSRGRLRSAIADLPEAPCYAIICLNSSYIEDQYARLETGFVAGNILMQATAIGLGCHFNSGLTSSERSGIQAATNIPSSHVPYAIVSIGQPEINVSIFVVLQGRNRPDPGWAIPLTVKFFTPGADVLNDVPIHEFVLTTVRSASGNTAVCRATGVTPGTYDISVQGDYTLVSLRKNVAVSDPNTFVDMGTLLEGNASLDGRIDLDDLAILSMSWQAYESQPEYDVRADFDRNGLVNITDLYILAENWLLNSPVEILS
jgi:hypothetical protein